MILDKRSEEVLCAVVDCYVSTGGPVGSRVLTKKYAFGLSPATIRNIMSDLEELGFLRQPHTSAGRVPTDIGYRFYVDKLAAERYQENRDFMAELNRKLDAIKKDINLFLDEASRMLSVMTHYVGITMSPNANTTTLSKIDLIRYRGNRIAVILFTDEGMVQNRVVTLSAEISQKDLSRIADYINEEFAGRTIDDIRKKILIEMSREKVLCDSLILDAIRICRDIFSVTAGNVYISGLSEMLDLPDFGDVGKIRELLRAIEDKHIIIDLLDNISDIEGTRVFIGSENPLSEMKPFSLVASSYREGNRPIGVIGLIGPTRMDYAKAIAIVGLTARYITDILSCD